MALKQTPSQTVGPYFAYGLTAAQYGYAHTSVAGPAVAVGESAGERIRITGRVYDGAGTEIEDALIELWQADNEGRYAHPADPRGANTGFRGFARCGTGSDPDKRFVFDTIKPGTVDGRQAPHISLIVLMRGLLSHAFTRLYFSDEAAANATDPVLQSVPEARRHTLIAQRQDTAAGPLYRFDIHMQGDHETVFFDA